MAPKIKPTLLGITPLKKDALVLRWQAVGNSVRLYLDVIDSRARLREYLDGVHTPRTGRMPGRINRYQRRSNRRHGLRLQA